MFTNLQQHQHQQLQQLSQIQMTIMQQSLGFAVLGLHCTLLCTCNSSLISMCFKLFCVLSNIFRYASLLLVITASMRNKLEDAPFCLRVIKRRPLLKLPACKGKQHDGFSPLNPSDLPEIFKLFQSSFFIIPSMFPLWLQALDYFIQRR